MEKSLPYLVSPGSIKTALERIKQAATPERVTGDFMSTKINIKGGTGKALIPFLKKIGLVASDGSPTDLYRKFRNTATSKIAIAEAIKIGYQKLAELNEYFYDLKDSELLGHINQVTGDAADSQVSKYILSTFKNLRSFADFETVEPDIQPAVPIMRDELSPEEPRSLPQLRKSPTPQGVGFNLAYTINLNLPASSDQSVFNAIFRSLKEHLLADPE